MALLEASQILASAIFETAGLLWMEIAMFVVAAVLYVVCAKRLPSFSNSASSTTKHNRQVVGTKGKRFEPDVQSGLAGTVDSMRKQGRGAVDILAELRSLLRNDEELLSEVATLPTNMLRDDAVDLANGTLILLEEYGHVSDTSVYIGLMSAQLRRRDFGGVAITATRLTPEQIAVPKVRAMLSTAAGQRGRLDEALGHIRQLPEPSDGSRCAIPTGAVAQILALATRERRVPSAVEELVRVNARLESRQLDDLLNTDGRRAGAATCRDLLAGAALLNVQKGSGAFQLLASVLAQANDRDGIAKLIEELEGQSSSAGVVMSEPLALGLLEACKAVGSSDLVMRVEKLHRAACAGAPGVRILSAICSALAKCESYEAACDLYEKEMASKGIRPDGALAGALLRAAGHAGRPELAQQLSEYVGTMRPHTSMNGGNSELQRQAAMIKGYARERDLASATELFDRLQSGIGANSSMIYNCYLDACVQSGDVEKATAHFAEMKRLSLVDIVGYNTLLKAHLGSGNSDEARALIKEMSARGLKANRITFNELLHAKVLAKDRRGVWNIVDEMAEASVKPNSVTCSILLKSLTPHSHPGDVKRVIDFIDEVEEQVDEVLFATVIEACVRIHQLGLLSDLMRRYRQKGCSVVLTAPTYGSMIKAYGQAGDVVRVQELWQEMEDRGVKPTSITLGCMTEALVANGQADEAWNLLHEQLDSETRRGCINTVIYSTVLKGFATARRMDKVFAVYNEMRSKNIPCNTITYNTMLDACAKCCAMDRTSTLLEDMRETSVEPDIITYSTIVKGYCQEGDVDRAFCVLEEMKRDDKFVPDEIMYNSILDGCAKQHRVDDAMRVLDEMKAAKVGPSNYTLSILVKLLGHARRLGQALRMVEDLSAEHGFRPNVQVYTCLVQACVLNRKLDRALELHDTMLQDVHCHVDEKFYAVLGRGCLQMHQPLKAVEVARAAYQLPGHSLATPARRGAPVGMESRALEEIAAKLRGAGKAEEEAAAALAHDLEELRGVRIGEVSGGTNGKRMPGGGAGGGGNGMRRHERGPATAARARGAR